MIARKAQRTARIGIFAVAHNTYFGQFEGLYENLMGYHKVFCDMVGENQVEVLDFGMITTSEGAYTAAEQMQAANLDLIFCNMITYATSSVFAPILREVNRPMVLVALQPRAAVGPKTREGGIGGRTDCDVVRVPGDPVGTEGGDDVGPLLRQDAANPLHEFLEGNLCDCAVVVVQPLVAVRRPAVRRPRGFHFPPADLPERLVDRRVGRIDLPGTAVGRVDQDEAESRIVFVQRHRSGQSVGVVVGMGDNEGKDARSCHVRHLLRVGSFATVPA